MTKRQMSSMSTLCLVAGVLVGCGARSGLLDEDCQLPDAVRGVVGTVFGNTCVLEGQSEDGRTHRMECVVVGATYPRDFAGCRWVTDEETVCECDSPNWANTCPNGIPICADWSLPFDFAYDVVFEP